MNEDEVLGWVLAITVAVGVYFGMQKGWSARQGFNFAKAGLGAIPLVLKGVHSFSLWMRQRD